MADLAPATALEAPVESGLSVEDFWTLRPWRKGFMGKRVDWPAA
jgi:hypothetical protein